MTGSVNRVPIIKYQRAVAGLRKLDDPLKLAHAVRHLGDAFYYAGEAAQAEPCYLEALLLYRRHVHARPLDVANAIRSYAVLKDDFGAAEEARNLWQAAHDLYVEVAVPAGIAECAARLALLARSLGDKESSRRWFREATAAAAVTDDPETQQYVRDVGRQLED